MLNVLVPLDGSALSERIMDAVARLARLTATEVTLVTIVEQEPRATLRPRRSFERPAPYAIGPTGAFAAGVVPPRPVAYVETKDQAVARRDHEQLEYLTEAGRRLEGTGATLRYAVRFGHPAEEIIELARDGAYDLVAMTTHGRTGLSKALHGSVAAAVVSSGVAPVLVVRPDA